MLAPVREPPPIAAIVRTVITVLAVLLAVYLVYLLRKPLTWVVLACFLAIAVAGPVQWFSRYIPRGFAIALTYLLLLAIPVGIAGIVVPPIVRQGNELANNAPQYAQDARDFVDRNGSLRKLETDYGVITKIEEEAAKLPSKAGGAAKRLADLGVVLVNSLFALVNIVILSVFLVANGQRWAQRLVEMQPPGRRERLDRTLRNIGNAIGNYIMGALAQATIAGIVTFVVLKILGVPFAAPLAVLTALFDLIPLVGATIGAVIVGVVTLFTDFPTATIAWSIFAVIYQQLENTVIQPNIQRRAVDVNPFVVLVSVLFGSTLFGVLGALFAIPIAASIQIVLVEWWTFRHDTDGTDGLVPDPPDLAAGPAPA